MPNINKCYEEYYTCAKKKEDSSSDKSIDNLTSGPTDLQKKRSRWNVSPESSQSQANQFDVTLVSIALWLFTCSLFIASF